MKTVHANEWWVKELEQLMAERARVITSDQYRALNIALMIVRDGKEFNYETVEWEDGAALDYRALLVRYMAAVIKAESISYVDSWRGEVDGLLHEELAELQRIEPEALAEMNK